MITAVYRWLIGSLLLTTGAFFPVCLFAQTSPLELGSNLSVCLPATWNAANINNTRVTGSESSDEPSTTALLLTAYPVDPLRTATISVYRSDFTSFVSKETGGDQGVQTETERLLCTVLSIGYKPARVRSRRTFSTSKVPLVLVEVAGTTGSGENRIFTQTTCESDQSTIRLCASRSAGDAAAGKEIDAIIDSFSIRGAGAQAANSPAEIAGRKDFVPGDSPTAADLVRDYREALVMVEGVKGVGSGFLCKLGETVYVITNAHVLSGNSGIRLTNLDGGVITSSTSAVAVGHDVVRLEAPQAAKAFVLMNAVDRTVKIGDPIVVLGNAEGARVVKPLEGKVVGVGPNLIEVDAPFVPGNSGSPIIHLPTGKVLGIATYLVERRVSDQPGLMRFRGGFHVETRRFGFRIDSIQQWEPLIWPRFYAQAVQVGKIEALSQDFMKLAANTTAGKGLNASDFAGSPLLRPLEMFSQRVAEQNNRMSKSDYKALVLRLLGDLRSITRADVAAFDSRSAYDYFRHRVAEQNHLREELYTGFTRALEGVDANGATQ